MSELVQASDVRRVVVLGAGTMGQGIAQVMAQAGYVTHLYDVDGARIGRAIESIKQATDRLVQKGKMLNEARSELIGALVPTSDLAQACNDVDLVVESAPEQMELKVGLLREVKALAPERAILGTNTSSLSITEIGTRTAAAARTIGLHFFNPPPVMELLEVVRGLGTDEGVVATSLAIAKRIGKTPIVVNDMPGFATSRLGVVIGAEAMRMLESGVASAEDIDRAMELGYRHPMGPLKLTDLVGLDVRLMILEHLHREIGEQFRPPAILRQMVRAGRLGKKSGEGFYRWTESGPVPIVHKR
ncbi:3-hydroxyacyl-CoA dehydrogenase family protein [Polyangium mundeleinium]|uniref:3-hydroxyacyl-CoA dehydrogenase family protein n=1 Tax=Polyangium mundeleinium TaxID=2995306 RepID=A0ABT5F7B5_9BACT|nr:3-hydroxyacyl-CoA dehydrogenase family protein [Polyangium mundeleinium]MDC0749851.1 3-hydroxyacyl-CoA dehydrogenase family protein [Polyangium mundeleinium]